MASSNNLDALSHAGIARNDIWQTYADMAGRTTPNAISAAWKTRAATWTSQEGTICPAATAPRRRRPPAGLRLLALLHHPHRERGIV